MLEVTVKTLDGKNTPFSIDGDMTVRQFKDHVSGTIGIPGDQQRIIFKGKVLQDDAKLADLGVAGNVVHIVQRAPPNLSSTSGGPSTSREPSASSEPPPRSAPRQRRTVPAPAPGGASMVLASISVPGELADASQLSTFMDTMVRGIEIHRGGGVQIHAGPDMNSFDVHIDIREGAQGGPNDDRESDQFIEAMSRLNGGAQAREHLQQVHHFLDDFNRMMERLERLHFNQSSTAANSSRAAAGPTVMEPGLPSPGMRRGPGSLNPERVPPSALADILSQVAAATARAQPVLNLFSSRVAASTNAPYSSDPERGAPAGPSDREEAAVRPHDVRLFDAAAEAMHLLGHIYHNVSDLTVDWTRPPTEREVAMSPWTVTRQSGPSQNPLSVPFNLGQTATVVLSPAVQQQAAVRANAVQQPATSNRTNAQQPSAIQPQPEAAMRGTNVPNASRDHSTSAHFGQVHIIQPPHVYASTPPRTAAGNAPGTASAPQIMVSPFGSLQERILRDVAHAQQQVQQDPGLTFQQALFRAASTSHQAGTALPADRGSAGAPPSFSFGPIGTAHPGFSTQPIFVSPQMRSTLNLPPPVPSVATSVQPAMHQSPMNSAQASVTVLPFVTIAAVSPANAAGLSAQQPLPSQAYPSLRHAAVPPTQRPAAPAAQSLTAEIITPPARPYYQEALNNIDASLPCTSIFWHPRTIPIVRSDNHAAPQPAVTSAPAPPPAPHAASAELPGRAAPLRHVSPEAIRAQLRAREPVTVAGSQFSTMLSSVINSVINRAMRPTEGTAPAEGARPAAASAEVPGGPAAPPAQTHTSATISTATMTGPADVASTGNAASSSAPSLGAAANLLTNPAFASALPGVFESVMMFANFIARPEFTINSAASYSGISENPYLDDLFAQFMAAATEVIGPLDGSSTIHDAIQRMASSHGVLSAWADPAAPGMVQSIFNIIARHLTFADLQQLHMGHAQCLDRLRAPLCIFVRSQILNDGPTTEQNVSAAVGRLLEDSGPQLAAAFAGLNINGNIDIVSTVKRYLWINLQMLLQLILSHGARSAPATDTSFGRQLYAMIRDRAASFFRLLMHCLRDGQGGLLQLIERLVEQAFGGEGYEVAHRAANMIGTQVQYMLLTYPSTEAPQSEPVQQYIVLRQAADQQFSHSPRGEDLASNEEALDGSRGAIEFEGSHEGNELERSHDGDEFGGYDRHGSEGNHDQDGFEGAGDHTGDVGVSNQGGFEGSGNQGVLFEGGPIQVGFGGHNEVESDGSRNQVESEGMHNQIQFEEAPNVLGSEGDLSSNYESADGDGAELEGEARDCSEDSAVITADAGISGPHVDASVLPASSIDSAAVAGISTDGEGVPAAPSAASGERRRETTPASTAAASPADDWRSQVPQDWVPVIECDVGRQGQLTETTIAVASDPTQQQYSEAYLSGVPAKKRKVIAKPEMEQNQAGN